MDKRADFTRGLNYTEINFNSLRGIPVYNSQIRRIDPSVTMQDPFVAIVIDPVRTISAGKVNLGAFRTYPKGYKPPDEGPGEYQTIPLNKIEDFGVHCKSYYRSVAQSSLSRLTAKNSIV